MFCANCGTRVLATCPSCGGNVRLPATFCHLCGQHLGEATGGEPGPLASPPALTATRPAAVTEGEHKHITALCCTLASAAASPGEIERLHDQLHALYELAAPEVQRYEGTIEPMAGHSLTALFGVPVAHEDHARRAVLAALGLRRRVAEQQAALGRTADETLTLSMGIHTGLVVVSRLTADPRRPLTVIGTTPDLAQQLARRAEAGTILLSEPTARSVQGMVRMEAIGSVPVGEPPISLSAYQLHHLIPRSTTLATRLQRAHSRFVGREEELAILHRRLEQVQQGRGQMVGIVGEPGIGKSRLLYEFRRKLKAQDVTYLEGCCQSYGRAVPYLPLADLLRDVCGCTDRDGTDALAAKLRASLEELGIEPEGATPYLLHLLGVTEDPDPLTALTPPAIKARTFEALHRLLLHSASQRPLILALEDLHWIDAASSDYLAALVERLAGAPLLLVATARPGYRPPWVDRSYVTQIALQPLAIHHSRRLLRAMVRRTRLAASLAQQVLAKAEGNPFFLEELARTVVDGEAGTAPLAIPDTVQDVLMARLDRLLPEEKRLLQAAAVIGQDIPVPLWEAVAELPEAVLHRHLTHLQAAEFLYEMTRAGARAPGALQACPHPGGGLPVAADAHPAALPSAHRPGGRGALPRDPRQPA